MASSDITVAALAVTPTLRGNKCAWTYNDPRANALPNIGLDMVEVYASITNDRATASKIGEGITDFVHAGLIEDATWYYWIKARDYLGSFGDWYPASSSAGVAAKAIGLSGIVFSLNNGGLVASVSGNALTIAVKTLAGVDPSASDPVSIAFRNVALATGNYSISTITSSLSFVVSAGSTLGATASKPFRIWVLLFNDAGTLRLALKNCATPAGGVIFPLSESGLVSAVAEGGAGAADSSGVVYASQTITSKSFRVIGYMEWLSGFAGVPGLWSVGPDTIRLFGLGMQTPGTTVQESYTAIATPSTTTALIPLDNTIPQSGEGTQIATLSLTPQSACNVIEVDAMVNVSHSVAGGVIGSVFRDAASDAMSAGWAQVPTNGALAQLAIRDRMLAADTTARTYSFNIGAALAGTLTINGIGAGPSATFGGAMKSVFLVTEKMG
jgi:hypothetical protein